MGAFQGKYDFLITALLPLHKKLLTVENDPDKLIEYIRELKEYISLYDRNAELRLNILLKMLSFPNNISNNFDKRYILIGSKNEALSILTKFFFQLQPEE